MRRLGCQPCSFRVFQKIRGVFRRHHTADGEVMLIDFRRGVNRMTEKVPARMKLRFQAANLANLIVVEVIRHAPVGNGAFDVLGVLALCLEKNSAKKNEKG